MNIILCGLPMSGKTTIGKILANKLNWSFIDTDRLIENAYTNKTGKQYSCRQIYLEESEKIFRSLEKQQIAALKGSNKSIISTGGGSILDPDNIEIFQLIGFLIYIKVDINVLWKRMQSLQCGIPAYLHSKTTVHGNKMIPNPEKTFHTIAETRAPLYEASACITIETLGLNEQDIATSILYCTGRITHGKIKYGK